MEFWSQPRSTFRKTCCLFSPGAAGLHTHSKQNKNLFHSRGHSSFLQSRPGEPLSIFSLRVRVGVLQTHTVNHVRLVDV